ncbi:MAG: glycosyltransferase family 4 protein, partial [Burkholderiaceae bacterium]
YAKKLSTRTDIEVISMGVDLLQRFTPSTTSSNDEFSLLYAGRLVEKKGVQYLISAMPKILQQYPYAKLLVAGDGPDRANLEQLAIAEGVAKQITFIGSIDNAVLRDLYRQSSVFIAPSIVAQGGDQEGLGLVLVEALGCGCAVVATDLPAIRDVIVNGVTGLITRQKDSDDLACKVNLLLGDPALKASLAQAGRAYVLERFDWDLITTRYSDLFYSLTMDTPILRAKYIVSSNKMD